MTCKILHVLQGQATPLKGRKMTGKGADSDLGEPLLVKYTRPVAYWQGMICVNNIPGSTLVKGSDGADNVHAQFCNSELTPLPPKNLVVAHQRQLQGQ